MMLLLPALFRDASRALRARAGTSAVVALGLLSALTACLLVGLLAVAMAETDPAIPAPERVVLLDFKGNAPGLERGWFTASPVAFGPMLKARGAPLDLISRSADDGLDAQIDDRPRPLYLLLCDPDLVPLFGLKALYGDLRATLSQRDAIALTPGAVRKLWGDLPLEQALGRRFPARGGIYTVGAVLPTLDMRSPLAQHEAFAGFDSQANPRSEDERRAIYQANGHVYARLRPGVQAGQVGAWMRAAFVASPLYAQLPPAWTAGREAAYFRGVPLTQLPFEGDVAELRWRLLAASGAACALLLALAAFNAMNLQTALLLQRQRETAVRRALGARSPTLLGLWALEVLTLLAASALAALLLAWWLAPAVAGWMGLPPQWPVADPIPLPVWAGLGMAVLLLWPLVLAGPARAALRRPPAPALQGRTASEGPRGRRVRQGLLTLQLAGALMLLSLAGVLLVQQRHLLHADRGFETRNRLSMGILADPDHLPPMDAFVAALDRQPAITHWAFHKDVRPARGEPGGQSDLHVAPNGRRQVLHVSTVAPAFFDTYGMRLLGGRPSAGHGEPHLVIDAKAARLLGFDPPQSAVGALLRGGGSFMQEGQQVRRVVAVVNDVKLESARAPAMPQAFLLSDQPQWDLTAYGPDAKALRAALERSWKAYGPPLEVEFQSADEQRADEYREEGRLTLLLTAIALLAVGVSMLGAYALAADTLRRRRAELVLRRLHGAGAVAVARQVLGELAVPLAAGAAFGLPLAAVFGQHYLGGFVDRASAADALVLPSVGAAFAMLAVTLAAAARQLRAAVRLRPIEALR
jgi:hypothetical protein